MIDFLMDFLKDLLTNFLTDFLTVFLTDFWTDFSSVIKKGNLAKRLRNTGVILNRNVSECLYWLTQVPWIFVNIHYRKGISRTFMNQNTMRTCVLCKWTHTFWIFWPLVKNLRSHGSLQDYFRNFFCPDLVNSEFI